MKRNKINLRRNIYLYNFFTFSKRLVSASEEHSDRARAILPAGRVWKIRKGEIIRSHSAVLWCGNLQQRRPLWRAGNRTRGKLVQIRMLNAALLLETRVPLSPNTNAATLVLSLVQLVLQQPLEQNQQETQNERGQDESNVCFNISFLK